MDLKRILPCFILILMASPAWTQAINTEFGKNRIQFHDDFKNWSRYETENFITYWYGKSRNIAQPTIQFAELDHDEIQRILEHTISDKIEIIVYIDINDLKQSNIGLEQAFTSSAGTTKIQGNKMFVYFDGNHHNLRKQIRQGIAQVYMNAIIFGSNFQEMVQNALLLNLPQWFTEGIHAYAKSSWDYEIDDELRDLLAHEPKFRKFKKFYKQHPRVAGHSMWNYVAEAYGVSNIANIIYLTRINRNVENSFLFILGQEYEKIEEEWYNYYYEKYNTEKGRFTTTDELENIHLKNKKGVVISSFRNSPNNQYLAYVTNDRSKTKIFLRDLATGKEKMIFKKGYKNTFQETDFNYPQVEWHPRKPELSIIYEHRDITKLRRYKINSGEHEEQLLTEDYQRVYSFDYLNDDDYIFSASKDGNSDLYIYQSNNRASKRLTEDFYDELDVRTINYEGQQSVLFRSNRTTLSLEREMLDTILPIQEFDLYIMKGLDKERELIQLTNTPTISEEQAYLGPDNNLIYLSPQSGILNAYAFDLSTKKSKALTNLERNIIVHYSHKNTDRHYFNYYDDGAYKSFTNSIDESISVSSTVFEQQTRAKENDDVQIPLVLEEAAEAKITEKIMFQSEFDDPDNLEPLESYTKKGEVSSVFNKYFKDYYSGSIQDGKPVIKYSPMRASASRLRFRLADFTSRMDNSVLFEGLESYTGEDKELTNTPTGILFKGTVKDLFEDYNIEVGLRIPTMFNGYEYFFVFDNNKHLFDKRFAFYRKTETNITDTNFPIQREKRHTFLGLYRLKYPFDIYTSLRLTSSLRFDKYFSIVSDNASLNTPFNNEQRLSLKAEFVFDNSFDVAENVKNGTRYKLYTEVINEFDLETANGFSLDPSTGFTTVLGLDARHYIPILKYAVLALRGSAATSFGSKRIVYYLGGMENWIFSKFDETIPLPQGQDFSYKVLAPHLRGFKNNIRNGNTYALSNVELRVPIFRLMGMQKTGSAFLRNFQVTGFFDAGLAWYGAGPDASDNPLNTINVDSPTTNPVISIDARYFRDPLVMGYGFGFRSTLLSYFLKFDYAWGIETRQVQPARYYFSMGTDF